MWFLENHFSESLSASYWRCTASKGSVLPCMCLDTSHHSSVLSVGGSEELPACLPIGTSADQRCQGALDKEIGLCISKGHWKQMENRGEPGRISFENMRGVFVPVTAPALNYHLPKEPVCTKGDKRSA